MSFEFGQLQQKWLEALESGEYRQTTGRLHRKSSYSEPHEGFCCLGVAKLVCNLEETSETQLFATYHVLGLKSAGGGPAYSNCTDKDLSILNDQGMSFKEIANLLREKPEIYFTGPK